MIIMGHRECLKNENHHVLPAHFSNIRDDPLLNSLMGKSDLVQFRPQLFRDGLLSQ